MLARQKRELLSCQRHDHHSGGDARTTDGPRRGANASQGQSSKGAYFGTGGGFVDHGAQATENEGS